MINVTFYPSATWDAASNDLLESLTRNMIYKAYEEKSLVTIEHKTRNKSSILTINASGTDQLKRLIRIRFAEMFNSQFTVKFIGSTPEPIEDAIELADQHIMERMNNLPVFPVSGPYKALVNLARPVFGHGHLVRHVVGALVTAQRSYQQKSLVTVVIGENAIYPGPTVVKIELPGNDRLVLQYEEILNTLFGRIIPEAKFVVQFRSMNAPEDRTSNMQKVLDNLWSMFE